MRQSLAQQLQGTGNLSERELIVLQAVADGKTALEIAYDLGLSEVSIRQTMFKVVRKLDCENSVHAVVTAVRQGLID